jgi:ankyrin repeat protein
MPTRSLPEDPSLENLRKQAKQLRRFVRDGHPQALALVREFHPRAEQALADFKLTQAQLVLARSYRFASWAKLVQALAVIEAHIFHPPDDSATSSGPLADVFVRHACLSYGWWNPELAKKAAAMLAADPELSHTTIYTAAAAGDLAAVRAQLAADPTLVNRRGGALGWEPLLYACYSRVEHPGFSTLEAARALLQAGADPNAGWLWRGNIPPFTALTGAFGEGEDGNNQPPHPQVLVLARLLLEAGADPNDEQTLYNRHFRRDDTHLQLLLAFGLGQDRGGPWLRRMAGRMRTPAQLLVEELWAAARMNHLPRVKLLVEHGAEVDARGNRDGRTPYQAALLAGNAEIAEYLADHGARRVPLSPTEAFAVACVAGRRDEARAMLARDPQLLDQLDRPARIELFHRAAGAGRAEGVRLLAELGFPLDALNHVHRTPLHDAAWGGDLAMVQLLLELGADPQIREPSYHGTPLDWANHNHQPHVVAYLMGRATIFTAVANDGVERVAELLRADPALANARDEDGDPVVFYLHRQLRHLDQLVALLRAHGADFEARNHRGQTLLEQARERGQVELVAAL